MKRKAIVLTALLCFLLPAGASAQVITGGGNILYKPKGAAPVVFKHEEHIKAVEHRCSACHFGIFLMEKESLKMKMSMMSKGHFCGACHNGKTAFDVEDRTQCKRCHERAVARHE